MRPSTAGWVLLASLAPCAAGGCQSTRVVRVDGCDEPDGGPEAACRGHVADGDFEITGDSRIDGVLRGVGFLSTAVTATAETIETEIRGFCTDLGLTEGDCSGDLNAVVATVNAELAIALEFAAELTIDYSEGRCWASAALAAEATARCEEGVRPDSVAFLCEGVCRGVCTGECSGELSCDVPATGIVCEGPCQGNCELDAGGTCPGMSTGDCAGTCSLVNPDGECRGACDAECTGGCQLATAAECEGSCTGRCFVDRGSPICTVEATCRGYCDAECSGPCHGSLRPLSASVECEAASMAVSVANMTCAPPRVAVEFAFQAGADTDARGRLGAALVSIERRIPLVLASVAKLVEIEIVLESFMEATASLAGVDIDAALIACLNEELPAAIEILANAGGTLGSSVTAAASLTGCISSGGPGC